MSGSKRSQFPLDVSVYWGYLTGERPLAVERIFWGMRGENSSVAGGLAVVVITKKRKDRKMRMGCIMVVRT